MGDGYIKLTFKAKVGTFNSTGKHYRGHFSIWIMNELQELHVFLQDVLVGSPKITGWINGNLYTPSKEVFGILPIPEDVCKNVGMAEFQPSLDSKQKHHFLA